MIKLSTSSIILLLCISFVLLMMFRGDAGMMGSNNDDILSSTMRYWIDNLSTEQLTDPKSIHLRSTNFQKEDDQNEKKKTRVVGFWHIGNSRTSHESRDHFVIKQAKEILSSYLFSDGLLEEGGGNKYDLTLNYVTQVNLSNETKSFLKESGVIVEHPPKVVEVEEGIEYYEFPTLAELHSFCSLEENIESIVFYIHSKTIDRLRQGKLCLGQMITFVEPS